MPAWLNYCLGGLPCLFGVVLAIGQALAGYKLGRTAVEGLASRDWLNIDLGIENRFAITFTRADFEAIPLEARQVLAAGQLWKLVQTKLESLGRPVPEDGWDKVVTERAKALRVPREKVQRASQLRADLGFRDERF